MLSIVYFSESSSVYDEFFITKLSEKLDVSVLTFNREPAINVSVPIVTLPLPFGKIPGHDSPRIYSTLPIKALLLRRYLRALKPDVLIGCGLDYGLSSALSGFERFFSFIWGSEVLLQPRLPPFRAMIELVLSKAGRVLVDSNVQVEACQNLGCNPGKIVSLPWVDSNELEDKLKGIESDRRGFRRSLGWPEDAIIVVCTRSHTPVYNVECVLESATDVVDKAKNVRFLFLGGGPLTKRLMDLGAELGLSGRVHFAGRLEYASLLRYLINSDVYVSSSLSDGTSASLIEAMTCRLPCVVSDIPGNREWIRDGENGFLFPPRGSKRLSVLLIGLAGDESTRRRLGDAAFETSVTKGDWAVNSLPLLSAIEELSVSRYRPSC